MNVLFQGDNLYTVQMDTGHSNTGIMNQQDTSSPDTCSQPSFPQQKMWSTEDLERIKSRQMKTERRKFISRLRASLHNGDLSVGYLPIISLKSDELSAVEVILKIKDNRRGYLPAHSFMPSVDDHEVSSEIGRWMVAQAIEDTVKCSPSFMVSLPVSTHYLLNPAITDEIVEMAWGHQFQVNRLRVQVTEELFLHEKEAVMLSLANLRKAGIMVEMVNFGAGVTSLSVLNMVEPRIVRLDRSLTKIVASHEPGRKLAMAAFKACQAFDLNVMACGVETEVEAIAMSKAGCLEGQGGYYGQPTSIGDALFDTK
jgi:EAL domain-containing protein (putative c-di-GMP-specific phosphodiesterase class I)